MKHVIRNYRVIADFLQKFIDIDPTKWGRSLPLMYMLFVVVRDPEYQTQKYIDDPDFHWVDSPTAFIIHILNIILVLMAIFTECYAEKPKRRR